MNIDIKKIEALMEAMGRHKIVLLKIQEGEQLIELEHATERAAPAPTMAPSLAPSQAVTSPQEEASRAEKGTWILSPMVGTFYPSPSPDSEPFVKEGDKVSPDTVVCIIEAMKVMNEVKAGVSGTVRKIKPKNGDAVEFGTQLILVE